MVHAVAALLAFPILEREFGKSLLQSPISQECVSLFPFRGHPRGVQPPSLKAESASRFQSLAPETNGPPLLERGTYGRDLLMIQW